MRFRALAAALLLASCTHRAQVSATAAPATPPPVFEDIAAEVPAPESRPAPDYEVECKGGETLRSIATDKLGWGDLWRHLAEWNKLGTDGPDAPLAAGTRVRIPERFRDLAKGPQSAALLEEYTRMQAARALKERMNAQEAVFRVGERLVYDVKWFGITAGAGTLSVEQDSEIDGKPYRHFLTRAQSQVVFFFKVDDRIESHCSRDTLLPRRFEKHLHEGSYKKDMVADFDRTAMTAKWGNDTAPLGRGCRDLIAAFYHFRTMPLPEAGDSRSLCVHTDKENYELLVEVLRREKVKVPAGTFDTVVVRPKLKFEGLFKQKGDILIWLTDDVARIPVLVRAKVYLLGSVDIMLTRMERP